MKYIKLRIVIAIALFFSGISLSVHDFFCECKDPLRLPLHGFWYGVIFILIGFILVLYNYIEFILRSKSN